MTLLLGFMAAFAAQAQIEIVSCEREDNPSSTVDTPLDADGEPCALLVVHNVSDEGYRFEGAEKVEYVNDNAAAGGSYYKVWISPGPARITIKHVSLGSEGTLYKFPRPVQSKEFYAMYLKPLQRKKSGGNQFLTIEVNPPTATVEVNNDPWEVTAGRATREVPSGVYEVRVSAPDYYADSERFTFDGKDPLTKSYKLKPQFGYLTIQGGNGDIESAAVFVDNMQKGKGNVQRVRVGSGKHTLKISHEDYRTFEQEINIEDDKELVVKPVMQANFATSTITCDDPAAEIFRNGQSLGKGIWRGRLKMGEYHFEAQRVNHEPSYKDVTVTDINTPLDIRISAPVPITGSLAVESTPPGATISIDGKEMGVTPRSFHDVIIGAHRVTLSKTGYQSSTVDVTVTKDQTTRVKETLSDVGEMTISVWPTYSTLEVDGKRLNVNGGKATLHGAVGSSHHANLSYYDSYTKLSKSFTLTPGQELSLRLKKRAIVPNYGYFDLGMSFIGNTALSMGIGMSLKYLNLEFDYALGLKKSPELIYVNPNSGYSNTFKYSNHEIAFRAGYGITCGTMFQIIPQVGYVHNIINGKLMDGSDSDKYGLGKTYASSLAFDARFYIAFHRNVGLTVTPEYRIKMGGGKHYSDLADICPDIKKWNNGFNLKAAVTIAF